jgi:hypothetical protein
MGELHTKKSFRKFVTDGSAINVVPVSDVVNIINVVFFFSTNACEVLNFFKVNHF